MSRRRRIPLKVADPAAQAEEAARLAFLDQPLDGPTRTWAGSEPQEPVAIQGWVADDDDFPPQPDDGWAQG